MSGKDWRADKAYDESIVEAWFPRDSTDIEKRLQIAAGAFFVSLVASRTADQAVHSALQWAGIAFVAAAAATIARIFCGSVILLPWMRLVSVSSCA
jgi:hypothetical protein